MALMESWYPAATAQSWDRVGLIVGDPSAPVRSILLALDPTAAIAEQAVAGPSDDGQPYDMVITHHPLLLRGASFLPVTDPKGGVVTTLIRSGIALFNAHTNADSARLGVAEALAEAAGLSANTWRPLQPLRDHPELGIGRVGPLSQPYTVGEIAERLSELLPASPAGILIGGDLDRQVRVLAVSGGSGQSLLEAAREAGADAFVTADLRHHPASDFLEQESYLPDTRTVRPAPALIVPSHWASEWLWLGKLAAQLELCAALGLDRGGARHEHRYQNHYRNHRNHRASAANRNPHQSGDFRTLGRVSAHCQARCRLK